ncbi:MAG: hypothetical protein ACK5MH_00660 [Bacteroidales bacterium]
MIRLSVKLLIITFIGLFLNSCVNEFDLSNDSSNSNNNSNDSSDTNSPLYIYPYGNEANNAIVEITIQTDGSVDLNSIETEIPPLKYNKSWLFMLTQDDCLNSAFHQTWAAINGKPISNYINSNSQHQNSYNIRQLLAGDLPPESYNLGKTLGTDDGLGKEVRFHITTTLYPEGECMNFKDEIKPGFSGNFYRFMKYNLIWDNVKEMLNYGNSIAFHNVKTDIANESILDTVLFHLPICQDSIKKNLSNRGCKVMARPDGNETYVQASLMFPDIQIITKENNDYVEIYPFNVNTDLNKLSIYRFFKDNPNDIKSIILTEMQKPKEQRRAVHAGVHNTNHNWVEFLLWLNDSYGKDGDNSVWMPSLEEYYEYNFYRIHSNITKTIIDNNTVKFTITLPSQQYFYYPSITLNLKGINNSKIQNLSTNDVVKGVNYGDYSQGVMINIDCRKYLFEHATHYVEQYERNKTKSNKDDALYFINILKDSPQKNAPLSRIK